jgi:cold shock CspA family protein
MACEDARLLERISAWRGSWGFVRPSEAFVHISDLELDEGEERVPAVGDVVSFVLTKTAKGPRARKVRFA